MDSKPRASFWRVLTDLIKINPVAAAQFADECACLLDGDTSIAYACAEEELVSLVNQPLGQPVRGDGLGKATTFVFMLDGDVNDIITVSGPGDRLDRAWAELAERNETLETDLRDQVIVYETFGSIAHVEAR